MLPGVSGLADDDGDACGVGWCIGMFMSIGWAGDGEVCGVACEGLAGICIPGMT